MTKKKSKTKQTRTFEKKKSKPTMGGLHGLLVGGRNMKAKNVSHEIGVCDLDFSALSLYLVHH